MKAIQVKYLGPTNTKPARVYAWAEGGLCVILSWDHALNGDENKRRAAEALINKLHWRTEISGFGYLPNGDAVFTLA